MSNNTLDKIIKGLNLLGILVPQIPGILALIQQAFPEQTQDWTPARIKAQIEEWQKEMDRLSKERDELKAVSEEPMQDEDE